MNEVPWRSLDVESMCSRARAQLASFPTLSRGAALRMASNEVSSRLRRTGSALDSARFSWPQALLALGLEAHDSPQNELSIRDFVARWERRGSPLHHLDMAMIGHAYIYLHAREGLSGHDRRIERIIDFLETRRRDSLGSLIYRDGPEPLVLVDSLGITCPLLARLAKETGNPELLHQAILQIENFWSHGFQISTGLPYHGYGGNGVKSGIVGWGRGVGWAALGLTQTIAFSGDDAGVRELLVPKLEGLLRVIRNYQMKNGAFAWQLQATEGPTDSSSTGMITYAGAVGIERGWIKYDEFGALVTSGMQALAGMESQGVIRHASGECLGVGCYPQIFGEYPWGTAAALLVASVTGLCKWADTERTYD